jgi:hypothetical protein
VELRHKPSALAVGSLTPNLPVLGKKYGRLIPKIKTALESLQGAAALAAAHALEEDQPIEIPVDGQTLWLEPAEVLVEATSPAGYAVAEGNGVLVALDTTLTPELRLEGQTRDLVRFIQDARKAAGFAITDRIHVTLLFSILQENLGNLERRGDFFLFPGKGKGAHRRRTHEGTQEQPGDHHPPGRTVRATDSAGGGFLRDGWTCRRDCPGR